MSWDYFALFAIVALLFWGWGAFAAWRGKRPAVVYTFTCLGLVVFFSFIVGMWISLERPPMRTMGEYPSVVFVFSSVGGNHHFTAVGSINGFSVSVPFCHWCLSASIYSSPKYTIRL